MLSFLVKHVSVASVTEFPGSFTGKSNRWTNGRHYRTTPDVIKTNLLSTVNFCHCHAVKEKSYIHDNIGVTTVFPDCNYICVTGS